MDDRPMVTVEVSTEMVEALEEWSPPVQVRVIETPGSRTGWMMEVRTATMELPKIDEPPKTGEWAEEHPEATPEEIELGNRLGQDIDREDDTDTGGFR
jgi:hypothetical protein